MHFNFVSFNPSIAVDKIRSLLAVWCTIVMEHGHSPSGLTLHFSVLMLVPPNKKLAARAANSVVLGNIKFLSSCTVNIKKPWPFVQCKFSVSDK
jgi:hypothetical protein